jgi:hypothetical protein
VAVQVLTPLALVAKTGRPMWSARTKEMTPPSITATGVLAGVLGRSALMSFHWKAVRARLTPAVPDVFADQGAGGLVVFGDARPSLSKTEWMVTAVGEERVRIA